MQKDACSDVNFFIEFGIVFYGCPVCNAYILSHKQEVSYRM